MRIDLHVHSNASDGTDAPGELVRKAYELGLDGIALTDHDTVAGHRAAFDAVRALPTPPGRRFVVVPGAELSCILGDVSLHLLGYLFDPTEPELASELVLLRTDRVRRARAIVDKLVELGVPITWEQVVAIAGDGAVGRPHIARAMVAAGAVVDVPAAFGSDWIGNDGRAYVEKYSLAPARAIALVKAAGGVTVFAHPAASSRGAIVDEAAVAAFATAGLDGLEVDHPDHDEATRAALRQVAAAYGLLVTGSSDYHGSVKETALGANTTAPDVFDALVQRATGSQVVST
ncbi:MAG: 3,5-nucleoside bisphosphate phosphatase [Actinomycetota bacterium]|jgi:predicted metal-dependent phosphoesterase TrpH|nr:3,5-nucleoside bisphosphate phosphatase [Actinomycetota bacterium]